MKKQRINCYMKYAARYGILYAPHIPGAALALNMITLIAHFLMKKIENYFTAKNNIQLNELLKKYSDGLGGNSQSRDEINKVLARYKYRSHNSDQYKKSSKSYNFSLLYQELIDGNINVELFKKLPHTRNFIKSPHAMKSDTIDQAQTALKS